MDKSRREKLSDIEGMKEEATAAAKVEESELDEVGDILEEEVDGSDLARLLPPDKESQVEEARKTPVLLKNDPPVSQDPPTMSWILPLPPLDGNLGGRCPLSQPCCPWTFNLTNYILERAIYVARGLREKILYLYSCLSL